MFICGLLIISTYFFFVVLVLVLVVVVVVVGFAHLSWPQALKLWRPEFSCLLPAFGSHLVILGFCARCVFDHKHKPL